MVTADPLTEYGHCGSLAWTVEKWGRVTHKHGCPNRTDPYCQSHPDGCPTDPTMTAEPLTEAGRALLLGMRDSKDARDAAAAIPAIEAEAARAALARVRERVEQADPDRVCSPFVLAIIDEEGPR